jgi:hypothetical protein
MIDHLVERGWTRQQAYALCSVTVDLKVSAVVDVPNMLVSAFLPENIFVLSLAARHDRPGTGTTRVPRDLLPTSCATLPR